MAIYVKAHRRGKAVVKAHSRSKHKSVVKLFRRFLRAQDPQGISFGDNRSRGKKVSSGLAFNALVRELRRRNMDVNLTVFKLSGMSSIARNSR